MPPRRNARAVAPPPDFDLLPGQKSARSTIDPSMFVNSFDEDIQYFQRLSMVENLPNHLEKEISELHSSIADTLIRNSNVLNKSEDRLREVLNKLSSAHEQAKKTRSDELGIYDQLKSIDSDKNSSAFIVTNKKKTIQKLKQMVEDATVPENYSQTLKLTSLSDIKNIRRIYEVLCALDVAQKPENIPPSIKGFTLAEERKKLYHTEKSNFANSFTDFIKGRLDQIEKIQDLAAKNPEVTSKYMVNGESKPYSVDVRSHVILRALNPYTPLFEWLKINFENHYKEIIRKYLITSPKLLNSQVIPVVRNSIQAIERIKNPNITTTTLLTAGEGMKDSSCDRVWDTLKTTSDFVFGSLSVEFTVCREYWGINDRSSLQNLIGEELSNGLLDLWKESEKFDILFVMRGYSLNGSKAKELGLPLNYVVEQLYNKWESYKDSQMTYLRAERVSTRSTSVLKPIKMFPNFIVHITSKSIKCDFEILTETINDIADGLMKWLIEEAAPNFPTKKQARLILLNAFHLCEKIKSKKFYEKNPSLQQKIDSIIQKMNGFIGDLLKVLIQQSWTSSYTFFEQISIWMIECQLTAEMVSFQPSHTEEKFIELTKEMEKHLQSSVDEIKKFLTNKIKDDLLRGKISEKIPEFLTKTWEEWDKYAFECYGTHISPSLGNVMKLL